MSTAKAIADPTTTPPSSSAPNASRRFLFWSGIALAITSNLTFFLQVFWANVLITPWYLPIGGTVAALMVLWSVGRQRRWWRLAVASLCIAVAGLEWYFLLAATLLPVYSGRLVVGNKIPPFRATMADGTEISESFFEQGHPTAVVFFQGRWCPFCMTHLRELEGHHAQFDRVGAAVVVVSIEDLDAAQMSQREFPHLTVVSDERRELTNAIDLINKGFSPDGGDSAAPTILLVDRDGMVQWIHRPARFIARPSAAELATRIEQQLSR